jgi:hypothetical protein
VIALPEALAPGLTAVVRRTVCVHGSPSGILRQPGRRGRSLIAAIADDPITRH